jgi:DNA-binding MarR family transcriptional regulator
MLNRRTRSLLTRAQLVDALSSAGLAQGDAIMTFHRAIAQRTGLNMAEQKTISLLHRLGPLSAGEIATRTGLATASVTSLIDRLEAKGFVHRVRDKNDRRRVIVALRAEGFSAVGPLFDSLTRLFLDLVPTYHDDELVVILDFMDKATGLLRREIAQLVHSTAVTGEIGCQATKVT